jgi:hypothetical protein
MARPSGANPHQLAHARFEGLPLKWRLAARDDYAGQSTREECTYGAGMSGCPALFDVAAS